MGVKCDILLDSIAKVGSGDVPAIKTAEEDPWRALLISNPH